MAGGIRGSSGGLQPMLAVLVVGFLALLQATPASAAPARITAADACCNFTVGPFEQPRGEIAIFDNPSTAGAIHNVYSVGSIAGGGKLFFSETIYPGNEVPVKGTQYLQAGEYPFVCTVHPGMDGTLSVTSDGAPLARPSIVATAAGQRLASVARKGSIRLSVRSVTGVQGARVTVRVGSTVVAVVRSLNVSAGGSRAVTARLSGKGRAVLRRKKSVSVSTTASVDFGKSSTTRKVLR